ncbi:MAG: hypothetical protein ABSF15_12780 [Candidatus Sulfotelmatobacter sp.]|jgi:hypothetical protein
MTSPCSITIPQQPGAQCCIGVEYLHRRIAFGVQTYLAGTELNVKRNTDHGPHTTETGATFLAMFTGKVDLTECFRLEGCAPIAPNKDR